MKLNTFSNKSFDRGASRLKEISWNFFQVILVRSWIPGSRFRVLILRAFGAQIGRGVILRPGIRIKFPWRLSVGDHVWVGEDVWIDNLAEVRIADNVCISQAAYLCTGSHDWRDESFSLVTRPIVIEPESWIGARSCVAPGITISAGSVLALGSVATKDTRAGWVHQGNPAEPIRPRYQATEGRQQSDHPPSA